MSTGNAKHQTALARRRDQVIELRADITRQLATLIRLNAQLEDLADTHQSTGLGFMTAEALVAAGKAHAADKAALRGLTGRVTTLGLAWVNGGPGNASGPVPAPVTVAATSASAEILFTVQHHVRRLARGVREVAHQAEAASLAAALEDTQQRELDDDQRGICDWPSIALGHRHPASLEPAYTTDGGLHTTADHLARLVEHYANYAGLQSILRDLDHVHDVARTVIDGVPAQQAAPRPTCPWCGRDSLVLVHREEGRNVELIRCHGTHPCTCSHDTCHCHQPADPRRRGRRHEWHRAAGATDTWTQLSNLQNSREELAAMNTRALDALERIRELHQPTWTVDGQTFTNYVDVAGRDLAKYDPDHVCVIGDLDACERPNGPDDDPGDLMHRAPACSECRYATEDGEPGYAVWPCPTYRATDLDDPAEETTDSPDQE